MLQQLCTPRGENRPDVPWQVHPNPQMKRDSYVNLNGTWEFTVSQTKPEAYDREILVPFCPESSLSGIGEHFPEGSCLWYRLMVDTDDFPAGWDQGKVLLHFGAVDQVADVYVGGDKCGHHEGGYEAFTLDITWQARQTPEGCYMVLEVCCQDDLNNQAYPYGKQVKPEKRGGMWYTPVSGIWQTVWLEFVPENHIERLDMWLLGNGKKGFAVWVPGLRSGTVCVKDVGTFPLVKGKATIELEKPRFWSPEDPYLYEFTLESEGDRIESYYALRTLHIKTIGDYPRLCLNGKPYFFHGLLDQGYWPEGLLTPPAPESYADDILAMKKLGFNTLRKHIKVEMEEFYYQCDKLGMIVWQDMVNNSDYNFNRDTALPTVGVQTLDDRNLHKEETHRAMFKKCAEAAVDQLKNHPCICCWTIFNEGWGQFDSDNVYNWFRTLDNTRFIDSTSGWFRRSRTDVDSRHVYFKKVKLKGDGKKPLVLSEFGGKTYKAEGHLFNPEKSYGYGGCETLEALNQEVRRLYLEEIVPCIHKGLCAAIYTQVSDVEDEINGLLTYDRRVEKLLPEVMLPVAQALQKAIAE